MGVEEHTWNQSYNSGVESTFERAHLIGTPPDTEDETGLQKKGLEAVQDEEVNRGSVGLLGTSTPLLCSACWGGREVPGGMARGCPGLEDHRPRSPLRRPDTGL